MPIRSQLAGYDYLFEPAKPRGSEALVLLLLHGTGGTEHDLVPLAGLVAPDAAILSPRGNVLEKGMARFFRRIAEGVFDLDDLRARTNELTGFIRLAAERHAFDMGRVVALGFSNGANIAASVMLSHPSSLRHGILIRAMVPFEPESMPDLAGCSALLSSGELDRIVSRDSPERLAGLLRSCGADVTLVWQPAGHSLVQGDVTAAQSYLRSAGFA